MVKFLTLFLSSVFNTNFALTQLKWFFDVFRKHGEIIQTQPLIQLLKIIYHAKLIFQASSLKTLGWWCTKQIQQSNKLLKAEIYSKVLKLNLFSLKQFFFRSTSIKIETTAKDVKIENKFSTIVTLLYWMGFSLPLNAQISKNCSSIEIKSRLIFGPQNYQISMFWLQKWIPGQKLSRLDPKRVKIGPKLAKSQNFQFLSSF